jgi:hypothetical protein
MRWATEPRCLPNLTNPSADTPPLFPQHSFRCLKEGFAISFSQVESKATGRVREYPDGGLAIFDGSALSCPFRFGRVCQRCRLGCCLTPAQRREGASEVFGRRARAVPTSPPAATLPEQHQNDMEFVGPEIMSCLPTRPFGRTEHTITARSWRALCRRSYPAREHSNASRKSVCRPVAICVLPQKVYIAARILEKPVRSLGM